MVASKTHPPPKALNALPNQNVVGLKGLWGSDWIWWLVLQLVPISLGDVHLVTTECRYGRVTDREKPAHILRDDSGSALTRSLVSLIRPGLVTTRSGYPKAE